MTKVFISYSRKDKAFAEKLDEALKRIKLDSWIDWDDIPPTADWWDQIQKGIEAADAFLFLLSPDSVSSQVCGQEIDHAVKNGKRLIPLVVRDINPKEVHTALTKLNWIFFREQDDFSISMKNLEAGIKIDLAWVESHRRLQVRAVEWGKRKERSLLLRGKDLREAEERLAKAGQKDPQPTDLQRQYVLESRRRESRSRNTVLVIGAMVLVALIFLSLFALNQSNLATENAQTAVANLHTAQTAQANAESERRIALSNGLSSSALLLHGQNEVSLAFLLSVQANQITETARSRNALFTLLKQNEYMIASLPMPKQLADETFPAIRTNARGDLLVASIYNLGNPSITEVQFILWDLNTYQLLDDRLFPVDSSISIDPQTRQLLPNETGDPLDGFINYEEVSQYLGSLKDRTWETYLLQDSRTIVASYCKFIKTMAGRCTQPALFIFNNDSPYLASQMIQMPQSTLNFLEAAYDQTNRLFALGDAGNGIMQVWSVQDGDLTLVDTFNAPGFISLNDAKGIEFIPDLQLVAWGTPENKILIWDLTNKSVAGDYQLDFEFFDFAISPDGTKLAIQTESGTKIFMRDGPALQPVETGIDNSIAGAMAFGGNGNILAIGMGYQIWVYDTSTWSLITNIKITSTGDSDVYSLSVSHDGKTIAVGLSPTQAGPIEKSYLIDIQSGLETGPFDEIVSPILSPDNNQLASMGPYLNENLYVWGLNIEAWKAHACQIANRNLTQAEWRQYMGNEPYQLTCPNLPPPP